MLDFDAGLTELCSKLVGELDAGRNPICLIDGRAGSGKTLFTKSLSDCIFSQLKQAPRVIHMDDLYPGWDGLLAGSAYLTELILTPLSKGRSANWQVWDWENSRRGSAAEPGNGRREFSLETALIVEGCGSLSRANAEFADVTIWLESDIATRRDRYSKRDEGRFDEYFGIWAAQEDEFYEREKSPQLAQFVISN